MNLPLASVVHGVADPTFASQSAVDIEAPATPTWTEQERSRIFQIRDTIQARLEKEVNRMEGQFSLMLSHLEGSYDSRIARMALTKRIVPMFVGFVLGVLLAESAKIFS